MPEVGFYHLSKTPLDQALYQILNKVLFAGKRAVVRTSSEERVDFLNASLWTIDPASFLPHGTRKEGHASEQPIWITHDSDNPNQADVLVLTDGADSKGWVDYERCIEIFDGNDEVAVLAARKRWKEIKNTGSRLTYWQQKDLGGWERKEQ
tara:strand:- start:90 stop:542 length:453 start_codon:yes stop_codon:yes gene_type:complete